MAQYPNIESIGSLGSVVDLSANVEVQVASKKYVSWMLGKDLQDSGLLFRSSYHIPDTW